MAAQIFDLVDVQHRVLIEGRVKLREQGQQFQLRAVRPASGLIVTLDLLHLLARHPVKVWCCACGK